ncbi:MAG: DNA translocase FtsK [Candidatus Moranbacteria bacterium]|nr:DNA translocase FtsK [Candidatus Moranbacteria bacterium]
MGRKKQEEKAKGARGKRDIEPEEEETKTGWADVLGGDAKRSIAAIFLLAFGILFLLAFFGVGEKLGGWLDGGVGVLFGWGKWLFPFLLFFWTYFLLRRRDTNLSDVVKFAGLGIVFLSLLGFFHLFLGDSGKEMLTAAKKGSGGGYVGYGIAAFLLAYTGRAAGAVILSSLFLSGTVAAFNVSLMHFLSRLKRYVSSLRKPVSDEDISEEESHPVESVVPIVESAQVVPIPDGSQIMTGDNALGRHNIQEIRFGDEAEGENEAAANVTGMEIRGDDEEDSEEDEDSESPKPRKKRRRERFRTPDIGLFTSRSEKGTSGDTEETKRIIQSTLKYFNISGEMGETTVGPTVTQYTFSPAFGTRLSKIISLSNDLALALARHPIRIEAPIPGKSLVGIEVPNVTQAAVRMRDILESPAFKNRKSSLSIILGETVSGTYEIADLESMPHLLIAGRTGSGKSVCINSVLLSLLFQNTPEDLQLILVDPKRVELSLYNEIPYLKGGKVITEPKHVVNALKYAVGEMERRLRIFESVHARDLSTYREKYLLGERRKIADSDGHTRYEDLDPLPYIVIVIDEMADLMMAHGKEVESAIVRLAQMSRAVGIHLVLATQKPISDVVTGLIKSNVPAKIAFAVSNQMDSRIILDTGGADKLIGKGDMLYAAAGASQPKRIQGVFVDDREVKEVVKFLIEEKSRCGETEIGEDFGDRGEDVDPSERIFPGGDDFSSSSDDMSEHDERYEEAKQVVIETGRAATTFLQRKLSVGYGRAAKLLDMLEEEGVVGHAEGRNRGRVVLVGKHAGESGEAGYDDPVSDQAARDKWQV